MTLVQRYFGISLVMLLITAVGFSTPALAKYRIGKELSKEIKTNKKWVQTEPKSPEAHFELAMSYAYTGKIMKGWSELKKVNELDSNYADAVIAKYTQKISDEPTVWKHHFKLAFGYYFKDKKEDAKAEFQKILDTDPKNLWALGYLALIEGEQGNVDRSITLCRQALKIEPDAAAIHYLLGEALGKKGDTLGSLAEKLTALSLADERDE